MISFRFPLIEDLLDLIIVLFMYRMNQLTKFLIGFKSHGEHFFDFIKFAFIFYLNFLIGVFFLNPIFIHHPDGFFILPINQHIWSSREMYVMYVIYYLNNFSKPRIILF